MSIYEKYADIIAKARANPGQLFGDGVDVVAVVEDDELDLVRCTQFWSAEEEDLIASSSVISCGNGLFVSREKWAAASSILVD